MNNNDDIAFKIDNTFDNNGNDSSNNTPNTPDIPDIPTVNGLVDENSIPAFTAFEVFPRFTKVDAGTTSNVEVNFDAMFSGTNQWNINKNYVSNVYVTQYDKDNPLSSKIYKSIQSINSSDQINITNTDYWQDETSTYFEILTNNNGELKAYHKYINAIPARYTHAIRIKSSYDPNHQNVIIDWGDGTIVELSSARTLLENEELSNILGSTRDGKNDIIVIEPPTDTTQIKEQFGKNIAYEYYCYHDYMPAMVKDGIVIVTHTTNDDGTINTSASANTSKPDKPYKVIIYGNSYFGIGKDGGVRINHYIKPEDAITGERSIYSDKGFNNILISRLFEADLPFYQYSNITIASLANNAPNLLYINLPKYYDGFDGIINTYEAFKHCVNLQYCNGFNNKMRFKSLRGMCRMFSGCNNMLKCDIKLAKTVVDHHVGSVHDGNKAIFGGCSNLAVDLLSLLPLDGFSSRYMSLINSFNGCKSLDTTLENANIIKYILWKDTTKIWKTNTGGNNTASNSIYEKGTTATFQGCSQLNSLKITAPNGELVKFIPDGWNNLSAYKDPENINNITPLTFKSLGESTISLNKINNPIYNIQLEYSINNSEYKPYIINDTITLYNEWELKIRATDVPNEYFSSDSDNYYKFVMEGQLEASGNIQTLLNQSNTDKAPAYCYIKLFKDCTSLINIKSLNLPATILNEHCYDSMFMNCSQIYTTITLDADTLSDYCYANMFYGCLLLTNMPTLHAKNLAIGCYKSMFENCTSLYNNFNVLPSDILKDNCYDSMFKNCSELTCTVIELPAKELVSKCYYEMFSGCSKLSSISVKFTDWKEDLSATTNWVTNVATNGLFVAPNILPDIYNNSHIPDTWENEDYKEPEIEIPFNSEYGEMKIGLGEDKDEVALIFTNSDLANMEWTAPCDLENAQFLVVGGGGGGGGDYKSSDGYLGGAGGGGGGVVAGTIVSIKKDSVVSVKVGAGGKGGIAGVKPGTSTNNYYGAAIKGKPSNISINNITYLSADGGGRDLGCSSSSVGTTGGSGGSSAGSRAKKTDQGTANKGKIIVSSDLVVGTLYGNKGGAGISTIKYAAGGGGGAIEEGKSPLDQYHAGTGGEGLSSDITGIKCVYGSGGGGGTATSAGFGGKGGTGAGNGGHINDTDSVLGKDALANQGGGGGGAGGKSNGGSGGSGIVVLRFKPNIKVVNPDIPEEPTNIVIDIPEITQTSFEFNNAEQSINIPENDGYTIEGLTTSTVVGEYTIVLKLNNGYIWSDGSSEDQEITWSITKAENEWITEPSIDKSSWYEGDTSVTLIEGVAKFGEVVIKLNDKDFTNLPTEPNEYTLKFVVDGTDNYTGLSETISFEILESEIINPEEPDTPVNPDEEKPVLTFNSEYGEAIAGLGENNDEVAVIFKNSDLANMEWTAPCDLENVQFLVVGGGGGGGGAVNSTKGGAGGAGGGGGCVVTGIVNKINKNDIVSIQIGKGGNGGTYYNGTTAGKGNASHGGNSIFKVNDITYITAFGGAGDLGYNKNSGVNNGSNSGSRYNSTTASAAVGTAATWDQTALSDKLSNVITYRNKGGYNPENKRSASGGGGGACGVGYNVPSSAYGGYGGVGLLTNITGDDIMFGAGGAGGTRRDSGFISLGGGDNEDTGFRGGAGSGTYNGNGTSGLPNQGGGGGGAGTKGNGGNGGSGIVVLRFKATNINIDPSYIKIKLTAPNNNYNINTVSDKINNAINENEDNSTFLSASTYYSYDTEYRIAAAEDASKNSIPIEFKWKNSIGDTTLKLWRTKDIESNPDAIPLFQTTSSNNYAIYYDPEVGRNYTYELSDSVGNVTRDIFYTSQRVPRVIYENQDPTTDGAEASNTRDIGGWLTIDGTKMVKQSMIYRSAMLEWCSPLADQNIISPNIHLQDNLGIRVELELRDYDHIKKHFIDDGWKCSWKPDEAMSITDSTIGPKVERYCPNANGYAAFPSYGGMFSTDSKKAVYAAFNKIYESIIDNKPVLFHCSQGKDRTGCLAYILLGMLGVSELNAKRDYGFTYYSQNKDDILMTSTNGYSSLKTNVLDKLPTGSTFQDRCKTYIKQCGEAAGDSDIDTKITNFIEFMLEDVDNAYYPLV